MAAEGGGSALKGQRLGISPADVPQSGIAGQRAFARASQPHWPILDTECTAVHYVCPCGRFNQIWTAVRWRYTRGVTAPVGLGHSTQDL